MGQSHSRRASDASDTPLKPTTTHDSTLEQNYQVFYGTENSSFVAKNCSAKSLTQPIAEITPPAPPARLNRYSELIDPLDLLSVVPDDPITTVSGSSLYSQSNHSQVNRNKRLPPLIQSPSGGTLAPQEFLARKDRPLAIRERQEGIRIAVERAEKNGSIGRKAGSKGGGCNVSVGCLGPWERAKVDEGRRAYERKLAAKEAAGGRGVKSRCFRCCFGSKDED